MFCAPVCVVLEFNSFGGTLYFGNMFCWFGFVVGLFQGMEPEDLRYPFGELMGFAGSFVLFWDLCIRLYSK